MDITYTYRASNKNYTPCKPWTRLKLSKRKKITSVEDTAEQEHFIYVLAAL